MTWELRWHPFRGQWVLFTSHRDARPWIGEIVAPQESPIPQDNALAPRGKRIATTNPDYRGVFVFTNDLPVFSPDAPQPDGADRASHAGYEAMGLGHPAATATVEAALAAPGVYGARARRGGCGGTIVVICERGALDHVDVLIR